MSWPLASHFSAMLQNPKVAFRDSHLQRCSIEKDGRNQPRPWAGAFAVVYKALSADRNEPFAVRVFTSESPERRERYDLTSEYFRSRKLNCLVDFEYRDQSIRSAGDGKWYPLILMEWVQGETLFKWIRARCLEGNTAAVAEVAQRWVEVVKELAQASVAHGDLQHANAMVTETGEVKLVDYDCMCVPALVGRRNLEVGVEPYQHPARDENTLLSLDLDNFSALLIYVALRALAADPGLWHKYVEQTGYDKLLFRPEDLRAPAASPLYQDLMRLPDKEVRDLTEQLFVQVAARMDQVPPLGNLANSYAKVEDLLVRQQWDEAVELLNRRGQFRDAPDHIKPLIHQAYEYVCRRDAWKKFAEVPAEASEPADRKLVDAWNEKLFAGYEPAERHRLRVAEARKRVTLVDRLRYRVQQSSRVITLEGEQSIVAGAAQLPEGYQHGLQARVQQARRCVAALERLDSALRDPASEAAIVAAWRALEELNRTELIDAGWQPRLELAQQRAPLLKTLHELPDDMPADARDRQILESWDEDLFAGCVEAERWQPAYEQALSRKRLLGQLRAAVESQDEMAIVELTKDPSLAGYPLPAAWTTVVNTAQQRIGRADALVAALRDQTQSSFYELFDARVIRLYADRFAPYQSLLREWTSRELLSPEKLGLRLSVGRASLVPVSDPPDSYRVRWSWPQARFSDQCLLAICPNQPEPEDTPEALAVHHRLAIDRQGWEGGGGSRLFSAEEDWAGGYVVVWAMVDLGFVTLTSQPLVLGRLKDRSRWNWKSWSVFASRGGRASQASSGDDRQ